MNKRYIKGWIGATGAACLFCGAALLCLPRFRATPEPSWRVSRGTSVIAGGSVLTGSRETGAAHAPRRVDVRPFRMGRCEVTVAEYADYLNATGAAPPGGAQIVERGDRRVAARGFARRPVTHVSRADAEAYCRWLAAGTGVRVRLPTEAEWECAARGGIHGARYPWGWGDPRKRACFASSGAGRVGRYAPNAFGLYDMAGNVFEWCADGGAGGTAVVRGGSWAESDPRMLCVYRRVEMPAGYRDGDVGFRIAADVDETL